MSIIINGEEQTLEVKNYIKDEVELLRNKARLVDPTNIVIHETAGNTHAGMIRTMQRKGLGIHFAINIQGLIFQHADPVLHTCYHAKGLNKKSVGIEIINPYSTSLILASRYELHEIIHFEKRPWWFWAENSNDGYVKPSMQQQLSLQSLVGMLTLHIPSIPAVFPTINNKNKIDVADTEPGIVSHCDFGKHSDGRYPMEALYDGFCTE